jgi:hypothetical protein
MRINSAPVGDPPFGKIRKYIEKALSKLNPDEVTQQVESADNKGFERFPLIIWEHESWNIEFRAIPKKREARGKPNVRPIGSMFYDFSFRDDISPIRASIDSKYAKYGTLEIPYVLALNAVDLSISEADVSSALFGSELGIYDFVTHHLEYTRKPDGAWYGPNGYQKKRMSGLLVFYRLQPELMHMIIPTLWHHPYANNPLKPHLFHLNQLVPNEITEILDLVSGRDVCSILGIDAEKMPH